MAKVVFCYLAVSYLLVDYSCPSTPQKTLVDSEADGARNFALIQFRLVGSFVSQAYF
jgi:hypothetical protein